VKPSSRPFFENGPTLTVTAALSDESIGSRFRCVPKYRGVTV
jgi:hypothetical protein